MARRHVWCVSLLTAICATEGAVQSSSDTKLYAGQPGFSGSPLGVKGKNSERCGQQIF